MTKPVGVPWSCPILDRLAGFLDQVSETDRVPAQICVELLRLYHHELRSAAEQRVPKDRAVISAHIDALFARLEGA